MPRSGGGEIGLALPLPSISLAGNWRGAAAGTLLGGKVLLTKPGGSLPEPTPLIGPAKLPANAYAGGKPGLRGRASDQALSLAVLAARQPARRLEAAQARAG
jgi:hypothetical protein